MIIKKGKKKKKEKKGQMEFAWIFAVIVGAMILFLAFYFVGTKLLSQRQEEATIEAQSLDILLNPFSQLGEIAAASATPLALQQTYNLTLECTNEKLNGLGTNEIILTKKGTPGISRIVRDKYIFAEQNMETKKFQALSMPFEMPWRVADIIILWPYDKTYCFINTPQFIEDKLGSTKAESLNISSIYFTNSLSSCPENSTKVCFGSQTGCDIRITNPQDDALMYASIFSDKEIYDCNVKRLASRIYFETSIYEEKARALSQRGCSASFNLDSLKQAAESIATEQGTINLQPLRTASQTIEQQNNYADCDLF